MPTHTPDPFTDMDGGNSRPADGVGHWVYWGRSFKAALSESRSSSATNPPFQAVIGPDGDKGWFNGDNTLWLNDTIKGGKESGKVHFKLSAGWQMFCYMRTENADFYDDHVQNTHIRSGWDGDANWGEQLVEKRDELAQEGWPTVWVDSDNSATDSRTIFVLNGDTHDYVSVDIDDESSSIAQTRVRLDGEDYFANLNPNKDVWIKSVWLRRWEPDYVWSEENGGGGNGGGGGGERECGVGYVWDQDSRSCVRSETPTPTPEEECNAKEGYTWNASTKTCDPDSDGDEFPETSILLIGLAIATVLILSFRVARSGA